VSGLSALKAFTAVVCPVPPLAIAKVPARVIAPVDAVLGVNPVVPAEKVVTPPAEPLEAAVIRPCASTVILALVYAAGVTVVFARESAGVVPPLETIGAVPVTEVTAEPQEVVVPLVVKNLPELPV
jgi:hypothetical protein